MKKSIISVFVLAVIILLSVSSVFAQEEKPKQTLWWVNEYVVKPSKVSEYHALMKDYVKHVAENEFEYTWYLWRDHSFHYYSFTRVKDYNEVNVIKKKIAPIVKSWGDEKIKKWYETLDHKKEYFLSVSRKHQYLPENPRLESAERQFGIWEIYDIVPGKVGGFSDAIQKYLALLKEKKYPNILQFARDDIGMQDPRFICIGYGKNKKDYWEQNKIMWNVVGEDGGAIYSDGLKLIKKRELIELFKVEKLSYSPKKK